MRDGINIFEEDFWAINDTLNRLLQGTNARTILLIDQKNRFRYCKYAFTYGFHGMNKGGILLVRF